MADGEIFISIKVGNRNSLLQLPTDSTLGDLQSEIALLFAIPPENQLLRYQELVINKEYEARVKLSDMDKTPMLTRASCIIVDDSRLCGGDRIAPKLRQKNPKQLASSLLLRESPLPSSHSRARAKGGTTIQGRDPALRKLGSSLASLDIVPKVGNERTHASACSLLGRCSGKSHRTNIVPLSLSKECRACGNISTIPCISYIELLDEGISERCEGCSSSTTRKIVISCCGDGCGATLDVGSILWNVSKGSTGSLLVKFSKCKHEVPAHVFEEWLRTYLDQLLVKNTDLHTVPQYGDFVILCKSCLTVGGRRDSYSSLSSLYAVDKRIREHVKLRAGMLSDSSHIESKGATGSLNLQAIENKCLELVSVPIKCPCCSWELSKLNPEGFTQITCENSQCGQRFCVFCLKPESKVEEGCLFAHSVDAVSNPRTRCPLFIDSHVLFSDHKGEQDGAVGYFLFIRSAIRLRKYCEFMNLSHIVKAIPSLSKYASVFSLLGVISETLGEGVDVGSILPQLESE